MNDQHAAPQGVKDQSAKNQSAPLAVPPFAFRVDKERIVVDAPTITGREILAKVGKTPELFKLYKHIQGNQPVLVGPDDIIDLREHGLERFTTMARDTTEGRETATLRREFRLPELDEVYLDSLGLPWETVCEGDKQWLIIREWKIPAGYNHDKVSLALLIPANYSDSQIDMVYFREHLARKDGKPIGALAAQSICEAQWQRWSRHRTNANPWRPGIDDVASHLSLVDEWLRREFDKR